MPRSPMDEKKYSLIEHLGELRRRLIRSLLAIAVTTGVTAIFVEDLFRWLTWPILPYLPEPKKLVVLSPIEQIVAYLKIAVIGGVFLAMPFVLYQLWRFISPGLYPKEKRLVLPFIFFGTVFFVGGAAFGFFLFLPMTFKFLVGMLPAEVIPQYTVEKYYSLVTHLLLALGLIFELPLVLGLLSLAGVVSTKALKRFRKYAVIMAFVVAAVLTPTVDPYSQTLMALPLILFYELGILFAWLTERRRAQSVVLSEHGS
jgi:sec-independent protein translocase protein TatC